MTPNTVTVDAATSPATLTFADRFNVAVPFIDRHLAEGRGGKIAIRDDDGDTSYAELAEAVNRAGNALAALGLAQGDRVILAIKDCPAFFFAFWGAVKAGFVPVPVNTLLRAGDHQFIIEDSGAACVIWSPEFAETMQPAIAAARPAHNFATEGGGESLATRMAAASPALDAAPATAEADCFWLYTSGSTGTPKGAVHAHRDMVVTSQYYGVETLGVTPDAVLRRADAFRGPAPCAGECGCGFLQPAGVCLGGRAPARHPIRALARQNRPDHPRRDRHHRDPAHLHRQRPRRRQAGHQRQAGPGLRSADRRRRGPTRRHGRDRQPHDQGRVGHLALLEPARAHGRRHHRRLDPTRCSRPRSSAGPTTRS